MPRFNHNTEDTDTMADNENATRAPESDAQEQPAQSAAEQSVIPGDTPAQTGPTMGVSCAARGQAAFVLYIAAWI